MSSSDNHLTGCLFIYLFQIIIALLIPIIVFVIPNLYHYVVNDILSGNCIVVIVIFSIFDIIILWRTYKERNNIKDFYAKEYSDKVKELGREFDLKKSTIGREFDLKKSKIEREVAIERKQLKAKGDSLENEYNKKNIDLNNSIKAKEKIISDRELRLEILLDGTNLFEKVSTLYADAKSYVYDADVKYLRNKSHPAESAAEIVQKTKRELRTITQQLKLMEYKYEFLLKQFPQLRYYVEDYEELQETLDGLSVDKVDYDRVRDWISKEEYEQMSVDKRNQLALDKWINRTKKTNTQIGYEYEFCVGYIYRQSGWTVEQFGIDRGLEDMGRDIIATKYDINTGKTYIDIIQCKYWSKKREIHENVICQLFGTMMMYKLNHNKGRLIEDNIRAVLASPTKLSDTATKFAEALGVTIWERQMIDFPRIKCNVNKITGEKIYHLPFDQQYYKTKIENEDEFYAWTVKEAVEAGFRRAHRYLGSNK